MARAWMIAGLLILWAAGCAAATVDDRPDHYAGWWIQQFGAVDPAAEPLAARAAAVFTRVAAAADKKANRYPQLVLIQGAGDPYAVALPDGSVVLTQGALRLCYDGVPPARGDGRLAFILGHELAHLAKDDFWHRSAFIAVRESPAGEPARDRLARVLAAAGDPLGTSPAARATAQVKELQADAYGLVYMTIAGFDPAAVLQGDRVFFREWAAQATGRVAYDDGTHPSADDRAVFLESQLAPVVGELDFFHFGVRLYQLGRYHDAILLLNRFLQRFPGREVYGDLALCHYQLAMRALARLDPDALYRFQLPVVLDPVTLAERLRLRGGNVPAAAGHPSVIQHLDPALQQLEQALQLDPAYTTGRANLCAALIARGRYARALSVADEAPPDAPPDPALRECKAVALYLYGRDSGIDTGDNAMVLLRELEQAFPERASVRYNLGTILAERGRSAAARECWEAFLAREGAGEYADWVRQRLAGGDTAPPATPVRPATAPAGPAPALPLGKPSAKTAEALKGMAKTPFELGEFSGAVYRGGGVRALELDFVLEVVEQDLAAPLAPARARELYGPPERTVPTPSGAVLVYRGFALESDGGGIRTVIVFAGE